MRMCMCMHMHMLTRTPLISCVPRVFLPSTPARVGMAIGGRVTGETRPGDTSTPHGSMQQPAFTCTCTCTCAHSTPSSVTAPFVLRVTAFGGGLCYVLQLLAGAVLCVTAFGGGLCYVLQLLAGGCVMCYSFCRGAVVRVTAALNSLRARTLKYHTQSVFLRLRRGRARTLKYHTQSVFFPASDRVNTY